MSALFPHALGMAVAMVLSGCMGGTGTSTDNGITGAENEIDAKTGTSLSFATSEGLPAAGLTVRILPADFNPLAITSDSVAYPAAESAWVSDVRGELPRVHFQKPGNYVLSATNSDGLVLLDTLRIRDAGSRTAARFVLEKPRTLAGRVRLESGLRLDSGWLVLLGTTVRARLDSLGQYDLGPMPPALAARSRLLLYRYRARPLAITTGSIHTAKPVGAPIPDTNAVQDTNAIPDTAANPQPVLVYLTDPAITSGLVESKTVVAVSCTSSSPDSTPKDSSCSQVGVLTYTENGSVQTSSDYVSQPRSDSGQTVYLDNGLKLSSCAASSEAKQSQELVPAAGGASGDFTVLDVSGDPVCGE